ncbi:MAG: type II toxin-antitoxin system PemK/MazF family toxin [bacterium]
MTKGTIILTPFPFTNLSGVKRRPAVIISSSKKTGNDVIVAFISSVVIEPVKDTEYVLEINHPGFKETGLKKRSVFKMNKVVTIEKGIIIGEIGKVSDSILQELDKRLKVAFSL